jgi:hypothetical protein
MHREVHRTTVLYALSIAGSERRLCELLGTTLPKLANWLDGVEPVPADVFLKAVEVVLNATAEDIRLSRETLEKWERGKHA